MKFLLMLAMVFMSGVSLAQSSTGHIAGSGNFFSPIVSDLEKAIAFYRDGLGLDVQGTPENADTNPGLKNMFGLPNAKVRWSIAQPQESRSGVEIVEISNAQSKVITRNIQDSGAFTLIAFVGDLDATLQRMLALGASVISESGKPTILPMGEGQTAPVVMLRSPDGHFIELIQSTKTKGATSANVIDIRVRLTVNNVEDAMKLYQDALGLKSLNKPQWVDDSSVSAALGVSGARYRVGTMEVPNSGLIFEVIDFDGIDRQQVAGNVQDPGSTRIQFQTRNITSTIKIFESFGGEVTSTDGVPAKITFPGGSIEVAIVREPSNLFVVLLPAPPA